MRDELFAGAVLETRTDGGAALTGSGVGAGAWTLLAFPICPLCFTASFGASRDGLRPSGAPFPARACVRSGTVQNRADDAKVCAKAPLSFATRGRGFNSSTPTVSKRAQRGLCLFPQCTTQFEALEDKILDVKHTYTHITYIYIHIYICDYVIMSV